MKKIILTIFIFFTVLGFSQDNEIYRIALSNKNNFDYLNLYDSNILNKMDTLKVFKQISLLPTSMFKYKENIYFSKKIADSLNVYGNMYNKNNVVAYAYKISEILSFKEQDDLYNYASLQTKNEIENIPVDNVKIIKNKDEDVYLFHISNVIYSNDGKYAFLRIGVGTTNDYTVGITTFIFKRKINCWKIIYIDKFFNL